MEELAINGGKPVRDKKIFYGRQWVDDEDIDAVANVLRSDYITCGPKVLECEKKLCDYTGAKHAVIVSNGTAALHCACLAAGIGLGDEVITTPITFAASANCALYCGAKVVFADVLEDTYNIDPKSIEANITDKTKAVVAVDFAGQAVMLDEIREICKRHGLILIEDAAHSIGTKYKGRMVGSIADMTCFSFHPVKTITCGEGGAILTNDDELYKKLVLAHTHGITKKDEEFLGESEGVWYYEEQSLGYNYRMTDFQAAMLISQLSKIDTFIARRKEIVAAYNKAFAKVDCLITPKNIEESDTSNHLYVLGLNLDKLKCNRREFFDALACENVQPQVHYIPVYHFPYYRKLGYVGEICPVAERVYERILSLPLYPLMIDSDIEDVCKAVMKVVEYYRK